MFNGHQFKQLEHVGYVEFTGVVVVDFVEVTPDGKGVVESGFRWLVNFLKAAAVVVVAVVVVVVVVESILDVAVVVLAGQGRILYFC